MPVWLELFNDVNKQGIRFGAIIVVLEHRLRPDVVDQQFLTIVDESIAKANEGSGGIKLDPRRLLVIWNKADTSENEPDELVEFSRRYYRHCHETFKLKNFPSEEALFENEQFLVIPKMKLGLKPDEKIEDKPDKANKLVHDIWDAMQKKMEAYIQKGSLGDSIQMGQLSHEEVLERF